MKNLKLTIAYEGTSYLGWQKTKEGPSIEETLGQVLEKILQHPVKLQAASRTDAGVHAEGQVVNFFSEKDLCLDRLKMSCNALLPGDIRVLQLEEAPLSFHPTLNAKGKEYHYHVCLGHVQLPFERNFSWHFVKDVDIDLMRQGAFHFIGRHDFSALTNERQKNNVRELYLIEIDKTTDDRVRFRITGNHFLYKMVRNIVGTLLYVGCGMLSFDELPLLLKKGDRKAAGMTAPAHGLSLKRVFYENFEQLRSMHD